MSGETYIVNKSEYLAIMKAEKGIFIPRIEVFINKASVSTAYPENLSDEVEDRKDLNTGVLHDGTKVKRHFGQWVVAGADVPDDRGNYMPVKLNLEYYPEVAKDCVMTEVEYEKIKSLPESKRLEMFLQLSGINNERTSTKGLTRIV